MTSTSQGVNMDEYIPSDGFFTPKRPSFRMTPGHMSNNHHHNNVTPHNYNRSAGGYATPVNYHHHHQQHMNYRRNNACSYHNVTPPFVDDHRRMHSSGGGAFNYQPPQQGPRMVDYYYDRFGRAHQEHAMPMYYNRFPQQQQGHHGYQRHPQGEQGGWPFPTGIVTPPPQSYGGKGKIDKRYQHQNERVIDKVVESDESQKESGRDSPPSSSSKDSGCSLSNNTEGRGGGSEINGENVDRGLEGQQAGQDGQVLYNYDSPDVRTRKRHCPTQIPIQAIHYNDEMNYNWNMRKDDFAEAMTKGILPSLFEHEMRGFEHGGVLQQQNHLYMEQQGRVPQQMMGTPGGPPPLPPLLQQQQQHGPPFMPFQCGPHPEQMHGIHNIHPMLLHCLQNPGAVMFGGGGGAPLKMMESARTGFGEFQKDFSGQSSDELFFDDPSKQIQKEDDGKDEFEEESEGFEVLEPEKPRVEFSTVRFMTDDRDFIDRRKILNLVGDGEKEYKLFEDRLNPVKDLIREIYNCNSIDAQDPREMCCVKVLPKTLQTWPLDIIGTKWANLKKLVVNFSSGFGSCGVAGEDGELGGGGWECSGEKGDCFGKAGEFGVKALAKMFAGCQGGDKIGLGILMSLGMNLDKVVRDLDSCRRITNGFAGPLADRNEFLDSGWVEVKVGFPEYDLPFEADGGDQGFFGGGDSNEWVNRCRIKRRMFGLFSFETLLYIFYTFTGDALQLLAAKEMYRRRWRYHKIFQIWITPWISNGETHPGIVSEHGEWVSGVYMYFHYVKWAFYKAEFRINQSLLEGEPPEFEDGLWE